MADQDTVPENTIPPKVTPFAKPQGVAAAPGSAQPTTATVPTVATGTPGNPRRTSRIPLTGAIPPMMAAAPTGQSRTIRIKPVGPQPGSNPIADGPRPPTDAQVQASKSKTSRISLDAAIGAETAQSTLAQATDEAPKTIRLKRPTEMPTVKVAAVPPPSTAAGTVKSTAPLSAAPPLSQTSRISEPAAAPDNAPITQKRTIRVKRPSAMVITGGASEAAAADGGGVEVLAPAEGPDTAHALFVVAAIVVILLALGLAVVFSSQIFGPNASLTELSIWKTGPDFPLPGTVTGN